MVFLMVPATLYAGWTFNEIRSAVRRKATGHELAELERKHMGRIIEGEGYMLVIHDAANINGSEVHLVEDRSDLDNLNIVRGDVAVEIPAGSPFAKTVKKLKRGDKVSFTGRLSDIFGKTIIIRGSARISIK